MAPSHREQFELAHRKALRLLRLVNSLLDVSGIEATLRPTDLAALTADLTSLFWSATDKAGLRLMSDIRLLPKPAYVDGGR
jgi:signal transduction histidine kinase